MRPRGSRFRLLAALLCGVAFTLGARAATELPIGMNANGRARISLRCCFSSLPPFGFAPIDVHIQNDSGRARTWSFAFKSPGYSYNRGGTTFDTALTVEHGAARTFHLLIPLAVMIDSHRYQPPLGVEVAGHGVSGSGAATFPAPTHTGKPRTPFIAMSETLALRSWSALEKHFESNNQQLAGSRFKSAELPEDWRGLAGIFALWIADAEWAAMPAATRLAVTDWLATGGHLFIGNESGALPPDLAEKSGRAGLGSITAMAVKANELNPAAVQDAVRALGTPLEEQLINGYRKGTWGAEDVIAVPKLNGPLLMIFMGVLAAVIGPLNLFAFARAGQRHKLFWTTPLIALIASALLIALIIFQDGFGGTGHRLALVCLLPDQAKAVVRQEQLSRTGVLLDARFNTGDETLLAPITLEVSPNRKATFAKGEGGNHGGDWFRSRSLQAQYAAAILPTRARLELLNPAESRAGTAAPVVLSSIGVTLNELRFIDLTGKTWGATNVRTGEKVTLVETPGAAVQNEFRRLSGPAIQSALQAVGTERDVFWATTSDAGGVAVETLSSIRWNSETACYVGPISIAAAP